MKPSLVLVILMCIEIIGSQVVMAQDFSVFVVRHAEKTVETSNPSLSEKGVIRAKVLAEMLSKSNLEAVYSTPFKRTEQTVAPLASALNLSVQNYPAGGGEALAEQLKQAGQSALVVGHSNTVPAIVRALGIEVENLTEKDYGDLFIVQFHNGQAQLIRLMIPMP